MRTVLALLSWLILLNASAQTDTGVSPRCPLDTAHYIIFNTTDRELNFFGERVDLHQLNANDLEQVECLLLRFQHTCEHNGKALRDSLQQASQGKVSANFIMVNLEQAHRQYQGGRDRKGDIKVYLNGLCKPQDNRWKEDWLFFHDGGPCYWRAVINLTRGRIEQLTVNGFG